MKCLVTGAAGFIGSNLTEYLINQGYDVVGVDNFLSGKHENLTQLKKSMHFVEGDVRDRSTIQKLLVDVDYVFHLAAMVSVPWSVEDPLLAHDHNVNGTLNLLSAARDAGVKRLVFASSAAIYGDDPILPASESAPPRPASPYALNKLNGEQYIALFNQIYELNAVCLRFFNVFGPRQDPESMYAAAIPKLLSRILKNEPPRIFGSGEQTRDFIHVDDIVQGLVLGAKAKKEANGQVFNLGCGSRISINQLVAKILELEGSDLKPVHSPTRPGDVMHSLADISKAKEMLGFSPKYDTLTGLEKAMDWYRENL